MRAPEPAPGRRAGLGGWLAAACLLAGPAAAQFAPSGGPEALAPASSGGVEAVDRGLARLATHRRLLVVGAHPDDEDTALLALVALGQGGEAAYLSLTRGEGGQNLVGRERGEELGLLRTGELLAARRRDGARQFFTRAFDFGYSRTLAETFGFWPRRELLADVVRVIRRFRPQVVVAVFPPDERAGHGQHQASAVLAEEAYRVAGEPGALPALDAEGWPPWRPAVLYRDAWFEPAAATLELPLGALDSFTGRSLFQEAMASRSLHRSQDMGMLLELGPRPARLAWTAGGLGPAGRDLFAGVDTRLAAVAAGIEDARLGAEAARRLAAVEQAAREARERLAPARLAASVPALAGMARELGELEAALAVAGPGRAGTRAAAALLAEKRQVSAVALAAAAGVVVDAVAEREAIAPGQRLAVTLTVWNAGGEAVRVERLRLAGRVPWEEAPGRDLGPGELGEWRADLSIPAAAAPSLPSYLRRPRSGQLYDVSAAAPDRWGEPLDPPELGAHFELTVAGAPIELGREVVARRRDQALGEVRRPLRVVPPVEVAVEPGRLIWPLGDPRPRRLAVRVRSHLEAPASGRVELALPAPWPPPPAVPFHLAGAAEVDLQIEVAPPPGGPPPGPVRLAPRAILAAADGTAGAEGFDRGYPLVDLPHARPLPSSRPAAAEGSVFALAWPAGRRVGWVRGAADELPELLAAAGQPVATLAAADLARGAFSALDVVVLGSRAYEVEPALAAATPALLDWVRGGGVLIVLYQQYAFAEGGFAPYRLEIARPHDRVTDEASPVEPLAPEDPLFHRPNELEPADWEGWVQERGLYFARAFDAPFRPLLALADPGGPRLEGGLLAAPLGRGLYVYTGLSFFRQLPAGVPGGYRLLANLLALEPGRAAAAASPAR